MTNVRTFGARPDCPACAGRGYVVEPGRFHATARTCECVPACTRCGGTGFVPVVLDGSRYMGRCRCQALPDRIALFNKAGIPARHASSTFESYDRSVPGAEANYRMARTLLENYTPRQENRGAVFFGRVGCGKTHLLVALVRELIMVHGEEVRFVEFSHLLAQLKAGFDEGVGEATILRPLVEVPVLAIDELGKGRGSEWELTIIDALISHRYNAMATTLATTNFRPGHVTGQVEANLATFHSRPSHGLQGPTLADRVGERVFSRLKEMCTFVPFSGEDYRTDRR